MHSPDAKWTMRFANEGEVVLSGSVTLVGVPVLEAARLKIEMMEMVVNGWEKMGDVGVGVYGLPGRAVRVLEVCRLRRGRPSVLTGQIAERMEGMKGVTEVAAMEETGPAGERSSGEKHKGSGGGGLSREKRGMVAASNGLGAGDDTDTK